MSLKIERAFTKAGIPEMPMVRRHILANLNKVEADLDRLTSTEIAYIIKGLNIGYHDAKNSQKADYMDDMGCVWIGGNVQQLIPLAALQSIKVTKSTKPVEWSPKMKWYITRYTMDYTETC